MRDRVRKCHTDTEEDPEVPTFKTLRTALKLAGTVLDLNERLTALEANFDILDRAVKREAARVRAQSSRDRKALLEIEEPGAPHFHAPPGESVIGGIMKRGNENGR